MGWAAAWGQHGVTVVHMPAKGGIMMVTLPLPIGNPAQLVSVTWSYCHCSGHLNLILWPIYIFFWVKRKTSDIYIDCAVLDCSR